jgi:hypothetical protein
MPALRHRRAWIAVFTWAGIGQPLTRAVVGGRCLRIPIRAGRPEVAAEAAEVRVSILWGDPVEEGGGGSGRRNQASGDVDTSPTWIGSRSTIEFVTRWS